jgi:hypothetical protein
VIRRRGDQTVSPSPSPSISASVSPEDATSKNPPPDDTNASKYINADKDMLESNGKPDETDSAQGRTEGAATVSENAGGPKNRTGDLIFSSADIARPDMDIPGGGGGPPSGGAVPGSSTNAKVGAWAGLAAWSAGFLRWLYWVFDRPEPDELKGPNQYEREPKPAAMPPKSYPPPEFEPPPPTGR